MIKEFILCFNPSITRNEWVRVAEALQSKDINWANHKRVIDYDPFLTEKTKGIAMLAYNQWPFEDKPCLTWENKCEIDPEDHTFKKLPVLDGWEWVTENSTNYDETSGLFDSLNEGYWEERYKSKRYTQKFEPGDRVIMNGNVGGKNFTNELGTVLKYKFTGGGTGHPHRVYLILFDTWNDKERNFLMSPVQADQNREFIDSRCREGSCWYTTSDNLEPAPDSSELFDSLNESDDNWFDDVLEPYSSMDVEEGEWEVIRQGRMYPGNITLLYYFNISNIRDRIDAVALENGIDKSEYDLSTEDGIEEYTNRIGRATGYRVYGISQDVIGDRYVGDRLYDGDICLKFKGEWSHETHWAKEPVYHMMRLRDNAHFVIGKSGVRRKEFSNLNEAGQLIKPREL